MRFTITELFMRIQPYVKIKNKYEDGKSRKGEAKRNIHHGCNRTVISF